MYIPVVGCVNSSFIYPLQITKVMIRVVVVVVVAAVGSFWRLLWMRRSCRCCRCCRGWLWGKAHWGCSRSAIVELVDYLRQFHEGFWSELEACPRSNLPPILLKRVKKINIFDFILFTRSFSTVLHFFWLQQLKVHITHHLPCHQ